MSIFDPDIDRLLYSDETGDMVGLDEVQLLDEPPPQRVRRLLPLLRSDDPYLVYQATLVLAAWGVPEGLTALDASIGQERSRGQVLDPHRIDGSEQMFDQYAHAAEVSLLNGANPGTVARIYRRLLALYGQVPFASRLKYALLHWDGEPMVAAVEAAIERALTVGWVYMASQLLPVLARWDADCFWALLPRFEGLDPHTPDYRANIAEALGHLDGPRASERLEVLSRCEVAVVRDEARRALADRAQ